MTSEYDYLFLPEIQRIAYYNSISRGLDPVQNWREMWTIQLTAFEGDPTNKDWKEIEFEAIKLILEDANWSIPTLKSQYDERKAILKYAANDVGFSEEGQLKELLGRVFGYNVWIPNKFTQGDDNFFRCFFNNCAREENTQTEPSVGCYRKWHLQHDNGNTYFGLKSNNPGELITWAFSLPTYADLSALTIRWIGRFKNNGKTVFGPNTGGTLSTNGLWALTKAGDDKIYWNVHDGTSLKSLPSDDTHNNEIVEVYCIVDGTSIRLFIDGVEQAASPMSLDAVPAWFSDDAIYVGDPLIGVNHFIGSNFELSINHAVITP